ncbi:MAG: hypothetical protein IM585_12970 [Pseudanabaena sp. M135S2SP2A07QC]|nr:hypothetical protein [Pseudanabaena sp. M135S2SP2A07QC]
MNEGSVMAEAAGRILQGIAIQERLAKQEAEAIAEQESLIALQERNEKEKLVVLFLFPNSQ